MVQFNKCLFSTHYVPVTVEIVALSKVTENTNDKKTSKYIYSTLYIYTVSDSEVPNFQGDHLTGLPPT